MTCLLAVARVCVMVLGCRAWELLRSAVATDLCIDLHAVDATSAGRAMLTSLVVTKKTGERSLERSWSWSSEFRREAVRLCKLQQQQQRQEALGYHNVRAINKQPRI